MPNTVETTAIITGVIALILLKKKMTSINNNINKNLIIGTDLPLQGDGEDISKSTNNAIELYLKQIGNKVGQYNISIKKYDNSIKSSGAWDVNQSRKNAFEHVATENEIAVLGTFNSGAAKIIIPVLNRDPSGPMLMVSHANTYTGLTKKIKGEPSEPNKYYPTGIRNYARVISSEDIQGKALARFANEKNIKSVYVLNDGQTYGKILAASFTEEAQKLGLTILSPLPSGESWDIEAKSYRGLFVKIQKLNPDAIFFSGFFGDNGTQLINDKVAILGDNTKVKVMAPDGFSGYPALLDNPNGEGIYLSYNIVSLDFLQQNEVAKKFISDYTKEYGMEPIGSFELYAISALQVILEAIKKSDGTRKSVTEQVFLKPGITIDKSISILGKSFTIDPETGDISDNLITIQQIINGVEKNIQIIDLSV